MTTNTFSQMTRYTPYGKVDSRKQNMDMSPITTLQYSHTLSTHSSSRYRIHGVPLTQSGRPSAGAVQLAVDTSTLFPGKRAVAMARYWLYPPRLPDLTSGCLSLLPELVRRVNFRNRNQT